MTVLPILAGAALTIAACWAAGRLVFRAAGLPGEITGAIQFGTGAALLSALIFLLCALQLISTGSLVALGLATILIGRPHVPMPRPTLSWIPFVVFGTWYFINALAPESSADGTFYHLAFPARYLQHGGFYKVATNFYGNLPQGLEMLFLMAFAVGRHSAAALTHLTFLFVLAGGLIGYGTWIAKPNAGWLAALIIFTSPVIAFDATLAYNDVALAAAMFLTFVALMRWDADRKSAWLIAAGLLAGFAFAIKYTGIVAAIYAIGFVLWRARSLKSAAVVALCAAMLIAPWTIKNWVSAGDPVTPFFNRVFPNPYVSIAFEDAYRDNLRHFNGASLDWHIPIAVTLTGEKVQGSLGPIFLLIPLTVAGLRSVEMRRLLFAGVLFLLPWFANIGTRFLIPCAPFFAMALALSFARSKWIIMTLAGAQIISAWPTVVELYSAPYNWRLTELPIAAALRRIPEEEFLASRMDTYPIVKMIDSNTAPNAVIYTSLPLPEAYSERSYILNYTGAINQSIEEMRWTPFRSDVQPIVRLTFHPKTVTDRIRIVQKGNCGGPFSISEIRWTPDRAAAKLTADPDPWNAGWAHDGNSATRWKTWQRVEAGMYWEAVFSTAAPVETVEIDAAPDQSNTCIELETPNAPNLKPAEIKAIPLNNDIRAEVNRALRQLGVTHLLIHRDERSAADFDTNRALWGVTKLAESGPGRLYRLENIP